MMSGSPAKCSRSCITPYRMLEITHQDQKDLHDFYIQKLVSVDLQRLLKDQNLLLTDHKESFDEIEFNDDDEMIMFEKAHVIFRLPCSFIKSELQAQIGYIEKKIDTLNNENNTMCSLATDLENKIVSKYGQEINLL